MFLILLMLTYKNYTLLIHNLNFLGGRGGGFGGGRGGGGGGRGGCYNCHQDGHIARECPEQRQERY